MTDITRPNPIMACGHASNGGINSVTLTPCCISCVGIHPGAETVIDTPDLTGRFAKCGCGRMQPSDPAKLAFFESTQVNYLQSCAICKYGARAHQADTRSRPHMRTAMDDGHPFTPPTEVPEFDRYYCGCRGWD